MMNKIDKIITKVMFKKGAYSPYRDKSDWVLIDYIIGYGDPLTILFGIIMILRSFILSGI